MSTLKSSGVRELRQDASKLLARVKAGETIEITEHGKPIALLTPVRESEWERAITLGLIILPISNTGLRNLLKEIKPVKSNLSGTTLDRLLVDRAAE